jgi:hypothetical protein
MATVTPALEADTGQKATNASARRDAARKAFELRLERRKVDLSVNFDPDYLRQWSRRWMKAEQEMAADKVGSIAAAEAHLGRMKKVESMTHALANAGLSAAPDVVAAVEYFRLEAEDWLAQAKAK